MQLAARCKTTQSNIARLERGANEPTLERVRALVRACGLELAITMTPIDDSELVALQRNLDLTPDQRVRRIVGLARFVQSGRAAMAVING